MQQIDKEISTQIAAWRKFRRLSQAKLAEICGWNHQSRIGNYEKKTRDPHLDDLKIIAKALHIHLAQLIFQAPQDYQDRYSLSTPTPALTLRDAQRTGGYQIEGVTYESNEAHAEMLDLYAGLTVSQQHEILKKMTELKQSNDAILKELGGNGKGTQ